VSRRLQQILIVVLLLVAVALLTWYLGRPKPVPVTLAKVEPGSVLATVANTRAGTVDACQRARLAPPIGGQIARLPFKEGDRVKADDVLLELWNQDLRAQVLQAQRDAVATRSRSREACVMAEVAQKNAVRIRQLRPQGL
jgi:HlyD family secretion protein